MASLRCVLFSIVAIQITSSKGHMSSCIDRLNSTMGLDFENNDWLSQDGDFLASVIENGQFDTPSSLHISLLVCLHARRVHCHVPRLLHVQCARRLHISSSVQV